MAQLKGAIEHFASKSALNIAGLGRRTVAQLVDAGLVHSLADLYRLTRQQLLALEGFGERSAGLLLEAIERSKKVSLDRFLMGLGIRQVGQHIAKVLAREFGSLTRIIDSDEAVTISGLIQQELGRIPKVGEELRIGNCRIVIHEAEPRSIRSVQIYREEKTPVAVEAPNLNLVS